MLCCVMEHCKCPDAPMALQEDPRLSDVAEMCPPVHGYEVGTYPTGAADVCSDSHKGGVAA